MLTFQKSRTPRSRTETLPLPKRTCFHLHLYPMLFVPLAADDSVGAYLPCQWAGRRSNPRLRFFRPPPALVKWASPASQLPAQIGFVVGVVRSMRTRKKARWSGVTPEPFWNSAFMKKSFANESECHIRRGYAGASFKFDDCPPKNVPSCICASRLD